MEEVISYLKQEEIGIIKENVSFKNLTTFRTGGIARCVISPSNVENLKKVVNKLKENNIQFKMFGNGSNILASDNYYNGVIIKLDLLNNLEEKDGLIEVEAGYSLMKLALEYSKKGYSGLEWACGIPATIGGAVYMNAGAYLSDISNILIDVTILDDDLNIVVLEKKDLDYSYRSSIFMKKNWIILKATLKLEKRTVEEVMEVVLDRKERRILSQPLEYPSAGSVFRNPFNDYAGRLIEECNLKGHTIGGAQISDKHANFIINKDNATSTDIKNLIELAQDMVYVNYKINLKVEQEFFNWE